MSDTTAVKPLWPSGTKIPFIVLSGEFGSGKTLFGLTILGEKTLVIDTEGSSKPYEGQLPFTRIDLPQEMAARAGGKVYEPIRLWEFFLQRMEAIPVGQYRVLMIDTVSEIEIGLKEYVQRNPTKFGYTDGQFRSSVGLMWTAIKNYWKQVLSLLETKFECVVICAHMRSVFEGGKPVPGKRESKGLETLEELASLALLLERKPDGKGHVAPKPTAIVTKSRLAVIHQAASGDFETVAILPPRMPECTPAAIRGYIEKPFGLAAKPKASECIQKEELTADQRLMIQSQMEEQRAEAARLELEKQSQAIAFRERIKPIQAGVSVPMAASVASVAEPQQTQPQEPQQQVQADQPQPQQSAEPTAVVATSGSSLPRETIDRLLALREMLQVADDKWAAILARFKVESVEALSAADAESLLKAMRAKAAANATPNATTTTPPAQPAQPANEFAKWVDPKTNGVAAIKT